MPNAVAGDILLTEDGDRMLDANGDVLRSDGAGDACCCAGPVVPCVRADEVLVHEPFNYCTASMVEDGQRTGVLVAGCTEESLRVRRNGQRASCDRLVVWAARTVQAGGFSGGGPDHRLKWYGRDVPAGSDPGHGPLLDQEPFWWPVCGLAGFKVCGANWAEPTLADAYALLSLDPNFPAAGVAVNVFSLCVYYYHPYDRQGNRTRKPEDGGLSCRYTCQRI